MARHRILFVLVVVTAAPAFAQTFHTVAAPGPKPGMVFIHPARIPLKAGGLFAAERATVFVPLNRSRPDSDAIAIDVFRFPRTQRANPETPPIFMLSGGPGFPGLDGLQKQPGRFESQYQPFTNVSDVIVVGQRGIGSSKPNTLIEQTRHRPAADQPADDAEAVAEFRETLARERQFWVDAGVDLNGLTVVEAAADVRDVAQALGYEKITLMGGSFGSHWGMTVMRRFPELVERAVLSGMEGPDHTWDHPGWYWKVYERVAAEAEADERLKPFIPEGGLLKAVEALVKKADEMPFEVIVHAGKENESKVVIDGHAMRAWARYFGRDLRAWPAEVIAMNRGDMEMPARRMLSNAAYRGRDYSTAAFWMMVTGSGITAKRLADFIAHPATGIIGEHNWLYAAGSKSWPSDLGDEFRANFETEIPTVIVHGTWDRRTPYENALELVPFFKNGRLITVKRGTHGAFVEAGRTPGYFFGLMQFLATGDHSGLPDEIELPQPQWVIPAPDAASKPAE